MRTIREMLGNDEKVWVYLNNEDIVYPAMKKAPIKNDTIYVSDAYINFAKPYALRKLTLKLLSERKEYW